MTNHIHLNLLKRLVLPAFFCFFWLISCDRPSTQKQLSFSGPTMGTTYSIKLIDSVHGHSVEQLQSWVDEELLNINRIFSTYIPDSELSRLNQAATHLELPLSDSLCYLLRLNLDISKDTAGRYDVTIGPLVNLWGFGPDDSRGIPTEQAIAEAKARVDYRALAFDCEQQRFQKTKSVYVDLSASAKGYATDMLAELLQTKGYEHAMIEVGGELRLVGKNASGADWRIAVEKPTVDRTGAVQILAVSDVAVATSGDYRNYYEVDGQRVSHTIDPVTAAPIKHKLASVTVVMEDGARADAWATAFNILGPEESFALAEEKNIAAYFLIGEGEAFSTKYTTAFKQYMVNP